MASLKDLVSECSDLKPIQLIVDGIFNYERPKVNSLEGIPKENIYLGHIFKDNGGYGFLVRDGSFDFVKIKITSKGVADRVYGVGEIDGHITIAMGNKNGEPHILKGQLYFQHAINLGIVY